MSRQTLLFSVAAFVLAFLLAILGGMGLANLVEKRAANALRSAYATADIGWVQIVPDGLRVALSGSAPDESARIRALQVAGEVIDASRVTETIVVPRTTSVVAPVFRIEVMRNRSEISVIGLVPASEDANPITARLAQVLPDATIEDMLQSSAYPVPGGWVAAEAFALEALQRFAVGRISVTAGRIEVEALVDGPAALRALDEGLRAIAPRGQVLVLQLVAPRPVAAPFQLRVEAEGGTLQMGACSADTEAAQQQIVEAMRAAGQTARFACPLALGAPTPRWGDGAAVAIAALAQLGTGSVTISDGSVLLTVPHDTDGAAFDRAVGRLETTLPEAFSLTATRLEAPLDAGVQDQTAPEVVMTLSEEGRMTLSGRLPDERIRAAVSAFAAARFGAAGVEIAARVDDNLPAGWSLRVLTTIEALAELHHGSARVQADRVRVTGVSGNPDARGQVSQILLQGLGAEAQFDTDVRYDEALDPVANAPTPDNCEERIHAILAEAKITFDPGSIDINDAAGGVIDRIAEVLRECGELPFEIAGHTDSQGRDETNLNLSQARAEAVINALLARRVLVSSLVAHGYGDERPIADNGTEAGREANRRIEFTLIRPEPEPEPIDPALEAQLVFTIQSADDNTIHPRPRPGSQPVGPVEPAVGSGD